ncbi:ABC transporter permease [Halopenitus sp. H-Gu1]|uniref:ABC transporter permease n=1 Tax=Halopenitus sp. H-Gu1 TaxID=3242697 RepID=UPI00359DC6FF
MTRCRAILGVALADFRERSRSLTLLVVPVVIAYFVKLATVDATLYVAGQYTGTPNAAWFGGVVAGIATLVFLLFGYPLTTGSIRRDRETGVGELLAASPLSNTSYLLGKWLSNFAVLTVATTILVAATTVSFLLQGTGSLNLAALISPFLLLTMPTMAVVAAAAVCFETISPLRGTLGTVVYFVSVFALIVASVPPHSPLDFTGLVALRESMASSIATQYSGFEGPVGSFAYSTGRSGVETFTWSGLEWTPGIFVSRLPVLGTAFALLVVAGVTFDRFGESGDGSRSDSSPIDDNEEVAGASSTEAGELHISPDDLSLTPVTIGTFSLLPVFLGELRLSLRGRAWWWYLSYVAGFVATAVAPLYTVRSLVVPISLLLLLPLWSHLGTRERRYRTEELVFVTGGPTRLLGVSYLIGAFAGITLVLPALLRFITTGMWPAVAGVLIGVLSLPAAAVALGVWTGRPRIFELGYLVAWYVGPMNNFRPLDYVGAHITTLTIPAIYLGLTVLALGTAAVGRSHQWG